MVGAAEGRKGKDVSSRGGGPVRVGSGLGDEGKEKKSEQKREEGVEGWKNTGKKVALLLEGD